MIDNQQAIHFEALDLLEQSKGLVPGFEKAYAFFYHPIDKSVLAVYADNTVMGESITTNSKLDNSINKLRKSSHKIEWVDKNEIPFESSTNTIEIQKEVFDELKHHILLFRIKNDYDNNYDLLYIYFKADASNFGIKNSDVKLSTDQKSIISTLIANSFRIFHKQRKSNSELLQSYQDDLSIMHNHLNKLKNNSNIEKYSQQYQKYIYQELEKQAANINVILQLTPEAKTFIKNYSGEIDTISTMSKKSVLMAYRAQNTVFNGILIIEELYLESHFNEEVTENNTEINLSYADSRKSKAAQFLNGLEQAARKTLSLGNNITGSNVGQAMDSPISAPAISDYIKKYRKPLQQLCTENPNQWQLVQKSFTPLKNILSA